MTLDTELTIWVIDDDPYATKLLVRQLESLGFTKARTFEDSQTAIAILRDTQEAVQLIFLDLQMPGMDGIEVVHALAHLGYRGRLVLVSGEDERILQAAKLVAQSQAISSPDTVSKPVSHEALLAILQKSIPTSSQAVTRAPKRTFGYRELSSAIHSGQMINYYEPKVSLATGALSGVETLVRWQQPDGGILGPGLFIDAVEELGLMEEMTLVVMRNALRQIRTWSDAGFPLAMSVNVSMDSLSSRDYPELVAREAAAAGVPTSRLTLEVTESRLMRDPAVALEILARLRLKGIGLAIDDFGTGHSSLSQLLDVPFDELKIDMGFTRGAWRSPSRAAIVEASAALASKMGMRTVAEGVEELADWRFVKNAGCEQAQGYFIAAAMPASALPAWSGTWTSRIP